MAANPFFFYDQAALAHANGGIDFDTDAFRMVLVGTGYTPNQATDDAWSDISANEISGTGYTANGKLLTVTTSNPTARVIQIDCDDQSWTSSTLSNVAYAIIVRDADSNGTLAGTDIPVFCCELEDGGSLSTTNGTLSVTIDANGVYRTTVAAAA
ncbi:hypothetical protein Q5Y75_05600 [Ruegeria sp. 2205SS24-7]|uniref:hypothetical protein n=1 Tax=Ruegeria discodermiae TaxID=3064389 RepID=UPI002741150E|nr:hypothetical protein [Ruegeria sp. 2205SS24-7]MDP5216685.1 hypothetical protein [Ruegeria sp. 2205SS24-7]